MTNAGKSPVTVLLVDDHAVVREGYRRLLERHGDILVVGEASEGDSAQALFHQLNPQIVVMDITLPGSSGIDVLRQMLEVRPQTRILIFSMHEETIFAKRALQAGAYGYVTKASAPHELVEAVHTLAAGKKYLSGAMARNLALHHATADETAGDGLSPREVEVLRLLLKGLSVREIARSMGLNAKTIANHQSTIRHKLGVDTAIQLLKKATTLGLDVSD